MLKELRKFKRVQKIQKSETVKVFSTKCMHHTCIPVQQYSSRGTVVAPRQCGVPDSVWTQYSAVKIACDDFKQLYIEHVISRDSAPGTNVVLVFASGTEPDYY